MSWAFKIALTDLCGAACSFTFQPWLFVNFIVNHSVTLEKKKKLMITVFVQHPGTYLDAAPPSPPSFTPPLWRNVTALAL